ncbi:MAG TPA: DUF6600 domain-containing protein [Verrucomicrobiae bacterium]|nr:DUF6600 domain-containing protein [Verrucomicrobiae bacterium]
MKSASGRTQPRRDACVAARVRLAARLALALAILLGPVGLRTHLAHAQDDEGYEDDQGYGDGQYAADVAPDPGSYGPALDPYGTWIDDDRYGQVWQPEVSVDWAPYTDGYWAWTPYGWTWVASEPWGWTFHYGRWVLLPGGWAWVPGSVWGPAWVDWYWGDGFVGWAPLAPFATEVLVIDEFAFVHEGDFCSHDLVHHVVNHHLVPDRVIHRWQHRDGRSHPPGRHRIEQVSHHPVTRMDHRPPGTLAPRGPSATQLARPRAEPRLGGARSNPTRLGNPWQPGVAARATAPAFQVRRPTLQTPPRFGGVRRGPVPASPWTPPRAPLGRPTGPTIGAVRPAPPAIPGGSVAMPHPGLLGQRRLESDRAMAGRHEAERQFPLSSPGMPGGR